MKIIKLLSLVAFVTSVAIISSCDKDNKEDENSYQPTTYADLSANGTANCYLISEVGGYKFKTVRGNTSVSVGNVAEASVLWESFGTDVKPNVGDLISSVLYKDGYIFFATRNTFAQGNAVIAAKDNNGTILWSWHIWCSAEGWKEQEYFNNAGTMMDRNLGALSATPGDAGALGLFYQWGRKDPFLGSSSISSNIQAVSTGTWSLSTSPITHTNGIEYPTTFYGTPSGYHYENSLPNDSWNENKTEYDPCPAGWRIPDYDVWRKALDLKSGHTILNDDGTTTIIEGKDCDIEWDKEKKGIPLGGKLGSSLNIWYPASGSLDGYFEESGHLLISVGGVVATHDSYSRSYVGDDSISAGGHMSSHQPFRADGGYAVRCLKE